jgi:hypothetical protein
LKKAWTFSVIVIGKINASVEKISVCLRFQPRTVLDVIANAEKTVDEHAI